VGENADAINGANMGDLFGSIQHVLSDHVVLAVTKLFERPRRKIWSFPSLLMKMEKRSDVLQICERPGTFDYLRMLGHVDGVPGDLSDSQLTRLLVGVMRAQQPTLDREALEPHDLILEALRQQRDKVIAHSEAIEEGALLTARWGEIDSLLNTAKLHLGLIGRAYLRTAYMDDSRDYLLTSDAERAGQAMRRLLTKADLRPARHFPGTI
jgi:hypothetical protein